jgi:hypothetical protein
MEHIQQYVTIWEFLFNIQLDQKKSPLVSFGSSQINDGKHTASSAYKMQFKWLISTSFNALAWKVWLPKNLSSLLSW